jgi:UDP-N-acetylglucosamine transferase subunit ALG13
MTRKGSLFGWLAIFALAVAAGPAPATDFDAGVAAFQAGDYGAALDAWLPLAEADDADAQHNVGVIHEQGLGVPQDFAAAAEWYRRAAENGSTRSTQGPATRLVDFIDHMSEAYAAADVVVCRAGATSMAELTVLGLPAVLVPYPHATADHQTENARALERAGGAIVIADGELTGTALADAVRPLLADKARYMAMSRASRVFGRPDAAANVTRLVLGLFPS